MWWLNQVDRGLECAPNEAEYGVLLDEAAKQFISGIIEIIRR